MRKLGVLITAALSASILLAFPAFAGDNKITSYAFADIAGDINGNTITVTVPYSSKTTYWNHRVDVSDGASFRAGAIRSIDDMHSQGQITVTSDDGVERIYTVNINKAAFQGPTYEIGKAKSIKYNKATIPVEIDFKDANVTKCVIYYYTKKNNKSQKAVKEDDEEVTIEGLKEDTKYYYYLSLETKDKTYETSAKSFTTKKKSDSGNSTSSSSTTPKTNKNTSTTKKGTNAGGPGTDAKQDTKLRDQWALQDGKWYYYGSDGYSKVGWFQVGGKWYYVTKGTNELAMGQWKKINGLWYYFDASGAMLANSWINNDGTWYYVSESGSMVCNQELNLHGVRYLIDPSGVCLSDVMVYKDNRWTYCKPGSMGIAVNEQFTYNGETFRADANGYIY